MNDGCVTRKQRVPMVQFALIDKDGNFAGFYDTWFAANGDACGPRFTTFTIRKYKLRRVPLKGRRR